MTPKQFLNWLDDKRHLEINARPLIMGIVNVTPDSFSDGGRGLSLAQSCDHAFDLIAQSADIIDIGGESTRPGASEVPLELELSRVIPVIEQIRKYSDVCISIDSYKPAVMSAAVAAGANVINDVCALRMDGALTMAANLAVPVCLMHMQGSPHSMQQNPIYPQGIITELVQFFQQRVQACLDAGIDETRLLIDPGFGFGKLIQHNLQIMSQLAVLKQFDLPILLGVSRKSTIGVVLDLPVSERLIGGIALAVYAILQGVKILRTHDVDETRQALKMIEAIQQVELYQ